MTMDTRTLQSDADDVRVVGGPGWVAQYHDYLTRTAQTSRANRERYERLIARVAAGDLAPRALNGQLNRLFQLHGADYANGLAVVTMRFVAGLIQAGTAHTLDLLEQVAPGSVATTPEPPPELDAADWVVSMQALDDYAERQRAVQLDATRAALATAVGDDGPPAEDERATDSHAGGGAADLAHAMTLYLDLLAGLDDLNAELGDHLDAVLGPQDHTSPVDLRGPLGSPVVTRIAIYNSELDPLSLRCVVSEVRRADGVGRAFEPEATLSPERFELAPGVERNVRVTVQLADDRFDPGQLYVADLRVLTPDESLVEIPLHIWATPAAGPP
jgi:hypothetical protein